MMDELIVNSLRFAIRCNFPHFCGEERTKEAIKILDDILAENASLRAQLEKYKTAEKEGRLIELPCKIGTPVYVHDFVDLRTLEIKEISVEPFDFGWLPYIGKNVFLTREAAEAALKGETE